MGTEKAIDVLSVFEGPKEMCSADSCENGGRCIQEWDSYTCDCDMTSFSGRTCGDGRSPRLFNALSKHYYHLMYVCFIDVDILTIYMVSIHWLLHR